MREKEVQMPRTWNDIWAERAAIARRDRRKGDWERIAELTAELRAHPDHPPEPKEKCNYMMPGT